MIKTIKYQLIFFILGFLNLTSVGQGLENNKEINKIFTQSEIETLNKILIHFDKYLIVKTNIQNVDSAYHHFSESLRYSETVDEFWKKVCEDKEVNDKFIHSIEDSKIIDELWTVLYKVEDRDTLDCVLQPNLNGKYLKLLNYLAKKDKHLKDYKEAVLVMGTIPPTLAVGFPDIHEHLDFNDEKIRLFVAIHYITLKTYFEN